MNTDEPFDLRSDEIKKNQLNNLFVGIKGSKRTYKGTITIKLYKQTNWNKIINSISIFTAAAEFLYGISYTVWSITYTGKDQNRL